MNTHEIKGDEVKNPDRLYGLPEGTFELIESFRGRRNKTSQLSGENTLPRLRKAVAFGTAGLALLIAGAGQNAKALSLNDMVNISGFFNNAPIERQIVYQDGSSLDMAEIPNMRTSDANFMATQPNVDTSKVRRIYFGEKSDSAYIAGIAPKVSSKYEIIPVPRDSIDGIDYKTLADIARKIGMTEIDSSYLPDTTTSVVPGNKRASHAQYQNKQVPRGSYIPNGQAVSKPTRSVPTISEGQMRWNRTH